MASWIVYTFISKGLGERYSSLKLTTVQTLLSILSSFVHRIRGSRLAGALSNSISSSAVPWRFLLGACIRILSLQHQYPGACTALGLIKSNSGDYHHYRQDCAGRRAYMASGCGAVLIVGGLTLGASWLREQAQQRNGKEQSLK